MPGYLIYGELCKERDALLINALTASDRTIIPIQDDEYSLHMMEYLQRTIDDVIKDANHGLVIEWKGDEV